MSKDDSLRDLIERVEWRHLPLHPYERYEASSDGQVRRGERVLRGSVDRYGYRTVLLCHNKKAHRFLIHRVVCMAFHGLPSSPDLQAAHGNGDQKDNRASNLRWATWKENVEDKTRHGKMRGVTHANAKLTEEDVYAIRRLALQGLSQASLARQFGIKGSTVWNIVRRRKWQHLPPEDSASLRAHMTQENPNGSQ